MKQWFKAVAGLDFCESSLEESICAYAILQSDALVINDLSHDARTRDIRIVKEAPFVRFYAGVPLTTFAGHRIGTICIMDKKPRQGLTLDETLSLEALARQVVCQLLLRQTSRR
jgi:GAF domain-containing protein